MRDARYIYIAIHFHYSQLPGTIHSAAEEIKKAGGEALAVQCDIRSEEQVQNAIDKTIETYV